MPVDVTVVTPTLNAIEHLDACIDAVRRQRVAVEHIVVDGGSSDGTPERAAARGSVVMQRRDQGIFDAINIGTYAARGRLIGFLGADDTLLDGALEQVLDAHERTGLPWVVGGVEWTDAVGESLGTIAAPPSWLQPWMHACLGWNCVHHMSTYMTKNMFIELGGFDASMRYSSDYDFFTRALEHAPFARVDRPVATFGRHGANQSMSANGAVARENRAVLERHGPASPARRRVWRLLMKGWVNATNPRWAVTKLRS